MMKTTFFPDFFVCVTHDEHVKITAQDITDGDAIFVSGFLMDPEFVKKIAGRRIPFTAAVANDFRRSERGSGKEKMLILEPDPGSFVLGALLLQLEEKDVDALNSFEKISEGLRRKASIRVTVGTCERDASTYLAND
jgi:hypothetical protein